MIDEEQHWAFLMWKVDIGYVAVDYQLQGRLLEFNLHQLASDYVAVNLKKIGNLDLNFLQSPSIHYKS